MFTAKVTEDALRYAESRVLQFMTVHANSSQEERIEAVTILQDHLGLDADRRAQLLEIFENIGLKPGNQGAAMIGILLMLYAEESAHDDV